MNISELIRSAAIAFIIASCAPRPEVSETKNEVVIIVDGLAYSERFYHEYGKEEGAYSMMTGQIPFRYLSIDPSEDITDIRESDDTTTVTLNADWMFVKYNFNPHASSDLLHIKAIPC